MNVILLSPRQRHTGLRGAVCAAVLVIGSLALAGCSSSADGGTSASDTAADSAAAAISDAVSGNGSGRAFGASDDAMITALVAATSATSGEWRGETLWLKFEKGSAGAPSAAMYCRVAAGVLDDGEPVVLAYPDGEVDCEESL